MTNTDNFQHVVAGIQSFSREMDELFSGRTLTCQTCGATRPAHGKYVSIGWPRCCGSTMLLGDKP